MNGVKHLDRDVKFIDWTAEVNALGTAEHTEPTSIFYPKSDGVLYTDCAHLRGRCVAGAITARKARSVGVHIAGPDDGSEYTPYVVNCEAFSVDETVIPALVVCESPASITTAASGDTCTDGQIIAVGRSLGSEGTGLSTSQIIAINENTADRGLCFAIAFFAGASAGNNLSVYYRLDVKRFIEPCVPVFDFKKQ